MVFGAFQQIYRNIRELPEEYVKLDPNAEWREHAAYAIFLMCHVVSRRPDVPRDERFYPLFYMGVMLMNEEKNVYYPRMRKLYASLDDKVIGHGQS